MGYKLALKDAAELTLPIVIAQIQELGTAIESEMMKRLLPGVLTDYDAHKPITFPGFCLNQDGVSKSDESLPWLQVEQVSLAKEKLTIKEGGGEGLVLHTSSTGAQYVRAGGPAGAHQGGSGF